MKRMLVRFNARNQVASFYESELDVADMYKFIEDMQNSEQVLITKKDGSQMLITTRYVRSVEIDEIPSLSDYERVQEVRGKRERDNERLNRTAAIYNLAKKRGMGRM